MKVDRYNYSSQFPRGVAALHGTIAQILEEGSYVLSDHVRQFESEFARYLNCSHTIGVNSGTDAILLALMALGIGDGDEVITQANTFHATVAAITLSGATPVLVDVTEDSFEIQAAKIEAAISPRTRAIIPVHLYGYPTKLTAIMELSEKYSLSVIEDAAQAHGATVEDRRVGTTGNAGCFSFHPSKNLAAAGDAGAVVTNDPDLAQRLKELRSLGQRSQNDHTRVGLNSKLDAIQAAVLSSKLPHLDEWNTSRRAIAKKYREQLADLPLAFQSGDDLSASVFHLFQIRTNQRDALVNHLRKKHVDAVVRYPVPIHLQTAFKSYGWNKGDFPVAEALASELLCLPIRPDLNDREIEYVSMVIHDFFEQSR